MNLAFGVLYIDMYHNVETNFRIVKCSTLRSEKNGEFPGWWPQKLIQQLMWGSLAIFRVCKVEKVKKY